MSWLSVFKHLLPSGRAWRIIGQKTLRRFFKGLSGIGENLQEFLNLIFLDLDPAKTRELPFWNSQFNLISSALNEEQQRNRLAGAWSTTGGQSIKYIQEQLQSAGFNVFLHEWWEPVQGRSGGSINDDLTPTSRNPFDYLNDGSGSIIYLMEDGKPDAQDGEEDSQDGNTLGETGYLLVNRILVPVTKSIGDGDENMEDGNPDAEDSFYTIEYEQEQYIIPKDPTKWPYFLYIGGKEFPTHAQIEESRRIEFEDFCLKLCPTEQWLGILVDYN